MVAVNCNTNIALEKEKWPGDKHEEKRQMINYQQETISQK